MQQHHTRTGRIVGISILLLGILIGGVLVSISWIRHLDIGAILQSSIVDQVVKKQIGAENEPLLDILPQLMGMTEPRTYLFLFLNNTELRPSGGFIGSYAVVQIDRGTIELVTLEGSEQLDRRTPADWAPIPPLPISEHLGVSQWYFRDANWDPDFRASAERVLTFYTKEGGILADDIDIVAAIDTEVLTTLLRILGPVEAAGKTFTADNVIELLQYDTSYGFNERDIPFEDRKQILDALFIDIKKKLPASVLSNYSEYIAAANQLIKEQHVQLYSRDAEEQHVFEARDIAGRIQTVSHDYVLWVDANLAALKTDHAIDRSLSYTVTPRDDGRLIATAAMTYQHTGTFDWRTSRYRTYARVFVPVGSTLLSTSGDMRTDRSTDRGRIDMGEAFDKQWFGTFISIEPGETGTLSFTYVLPEWVHTPEAAYRLLVEKQAGISTYGLTLDLEFGTRITSAQPAELPEEWYDSTYRYTDLSVRTDQLFTVHQ